MAKIKQFLTICFFIAPLFMLTTNSRAIEDGIIIRAEDDSPAVLYIVPWKLISLKPSYDANNLEADTSLKPSANSTNEIKRSAHYYQLMQQQNK